MGIDNENVTRRKFLNGLTVTVGAAGLATATGAATYFAAPRLGRAQPAFKGDIPDTPYKTGHITYLTGPANLVQSSPGVHVRVRADAYGTPRVDVFDTSEPRAPLPQAGPCPPSPSATSLLQTARGATPVAIPAGSAQRCKRGATGPRAPKPDSAGPCVFPRRSARPRDSPHQPPSPLSFASAVT